MATLIGVVRQVVGEVYAVAGDGSRRPLVEGDRVFAGEQIVTGADGAVAIALAGGGELTLGRDSNLMLDTQLLADARGEGSTAPAQGAEAAPSDQDLTDVEKLQAAIAAGADPTLAGEATAAGPGAGGAAGGAGNAGGGHSFVLLSETAGALDPVIGFPTEGFGTAADFPDPEPIVTAEPVAPDFTPSIEVVYDDPSVDTGVGVVDEAALVNGSNPNPFGLPETTSGQLVITSPDGISSVQVQLQVQNIAGDWIDITSGETVVEGQYGFLKFDGAGNWVYTITVNTLDHTNPGVTGADDQVAETFAVRVVDNDGDISPAAPLIIQINDDGPTAVNDFANTGEDDPITYNVITNGDGTSDTLGADETTTLTNAVLTTGTGTVGFAANGAITFTPAAGFEGTAIIHYTITDGDLDTSEADLVITVASDSEPELNIVTADGGAVVDEEALNGGSLGGGQAGSINFASDAERTSGSFNIDTQGDTLASLVVNGINVTVGGAVVGTYGTLQVFANHSWTYTLNDNTLDHDELDQTGTADQVFDDFNVVVTDSDGDTDDGVLSVAINDDGPTAVNDFASTDEDDPITYNVITNGDGTSDTQGADETTTLTNAVLTTGAGTVGFAANGAITFTPTAGFEGTAIIHYTITDGDLDTSEADLVITVAPDSEPELNIVTADGGAVVDEEALNGGSLGGGQAGSNPVSPAESTSGSFNIDTQGDTLASLVVNGINVTAGGAVVGTYGTLQVFANHSWTYTLNDNTLDHDVVDVTGSGDQVFDDFNVVVTDSDGDTDDGTLTVAINDDGPTAFCPDGIHVVLGVEVPLPEPAIITRALNFATHAGADSVGSVAFTLILTEDGGQAQAFTDEAGNQLYLNNQELFLYYGVDSQHIEARTLDGEVAMSAEIDVNGDVSITMFSGSFISNTVITTVTDLSGIGGGNVPFKGLNIGTNQDPDPDGSDDVLVSSEIMPLGGNAGTVNSSSSTLGVGQGQELSNGEVIRYDLVTGLSVNDQVNNESYSFTGYQQTFAFKQNIIVAGGSKDADFKLRIYNASGSATDANTTVVGTTALAQLALTVSEIVIYDANGNIQSNANHVAQDGNGVIVYNMQNDWTFEIVSVDGFGDPQAFNAVEIEAVESVNGTVSSDGTVTSFKLGEFSFGQSTDIDPVTFELDVKGTDGDGDSVSSAIEVTVYPDTKSIEGTNSGETLTGDGGENYLFGYAGNDSLIGNGGDDILLGGLGTDIMDGGAGHDTFIWQAEETGTDTILNFVKGFDTASSGDRLDLSELLSCESGSPGDIGNLLSYIDISPANPGGGTAAVDTVIKVDATGGGDFASPDQTIVLQDVDLFAGYGPGATESSVILGMLGDGTLKVDTV